MNDETASMLTASAGGVAGEHAPPAAQPVLVAPSTNGERNAIGVRLVPRACCRVDDMLFEFDSSFVKYELRGVLQALYDLMFAHPGAPLSIFGHADPVGQDDANKKLSGRRAQAIYALLTRNTALWEDLYAHPFQSDKWDTGEIQMMLTEVSCYTGPIDGKNNEPITKVPCYTGPINSENDEPTKAAMKDFQRTHSLAVDGVAGPATRTKLFLAYMDVLCVDGEGKPYQLDPKTDFLARGLGPDGKGDYQGCSEFNPVLIFSRQEQQDFEKDQNKKARNDANAPNRRVMILLFRKGSKIDPAKWPCPKAKEGVAGCKKRFWSDGEQRRNTHLPDTPQKFEETKGTFACRLYQRMVDLTSCEKLSFITDYPFSL